jgi:hypothetical protein
VRAASDKLDLKIVTACHPHWRWVEVESTTHRDVIALYLLACRDLCERALTRSRSDLDSPP